jgi:hypothetical protein
MAGKSLAFGRFLGGLRSYLATPLSPGRARVILRERLPKRGDSFLRFLRCCVFARPGSPYFRMFSHAGCAYEDVEAAVRRHGLDHTLLELAHAGIRLSLDEFKGRVPIVRGDLEVRARQADFDGLAGEAGAELRTGGSTGNPARFHNDLPYLAARLPYDRVFLHELGVAEAPVALWYPGPPAGAGLGAVLRYAKGGHPLVRWFDMRSPTVPAAGLDARLLSLGMAWISRSCPNRVPYPEPVPGRDVSFVLDWLLRQRRRSGRAVLQTYVSQAVRVCRRAWDLGAELGGIVFIVGSEPMTPAKHDEIEATGATVLTRYCCSELGNLAVQCLDSADPADYHVMSDMIGMVQAGAADGSGERPLLFTSLFERLPKVLINASLGDCGLVEERTCACPFGELGFTTHLRDVHSVHRVTCEGMTVSAADLSRIIEEALRPKYGGSTLDYQWVEHEDPRGRSRLRLRIAPSVGELDRAGVVADVLSELSASSRGGRLTAGLWREAGTIVVERSSPRTTASAKTLPFVRE